MLDLETTGGQAAKDRITEIAAVRVEAGVEVRRWSTLVNPGISIPPFIQGLTGISDGMVRNAPSFDEVYTALLSLLDGAVLLAHNVRFDHGFIVHELERLGKKLNTKTLCTVRLSRKLYPAFKSHGLDALMQRHQLQTQSRHRAMGDVEVILEWLNIAQTELGQPAIHQAACELLQGSAALPPQLETPLHDIPNGCGVYLFYGESTLPIYIGKSIHLRQRVLSHFQAAGRVAKEMRILQEIRRVEWQETAGELGALLLESRLVKSMKPIHNRRLRSEKQLCSWLLHPLTPAPRHPLVQLVQIDDLPPEQWEHSYGVYRSKRQAMETLRDLAQQHQLCPQWLGLESSKGPCFASQMGHCKGVCAGRETSALHRIRLQIALNEHRLKVWPYAGAIALREYRSDDDRTDIHLFNQWCHITTLHDEASLQTWLQAQTPTDQSTAMGLEKGLAFDLDTYRLLLKTLPRATVVELASSSASASTHV